MALHVSAWVIIANRPWPWPPLLILRKFHYSNTYSWKYHFLFESSSKACRTPRPETVVSIIPRNQWVLNHLRVLYRAQWVCRNQWLSGACGQLKCLVRDELKQLRLDIVTSQKQWFGKLFPNGSLNLGICGKVDATCRFIKNNYRTSPE